MEAGFCLDEAQLLLYDGLLGRMWAGLERSNFDWWPLLRYLTT